MISTIFQKQASDYSISPEYLKGHFFFRPQYDRWSVTMNCLSCIIILGFWQFLCKDLCQDECLHMVGHGKWHVYNGWGWNSRHHIFCRESSQARIGRLSSLCCRASLRWQSMPNFWSYSLKRKKESRTIWENEIPSHLVFGRAGSCILTPYSAGNTDSLQVVL